MNATDPALNAARLLLSASLLALGTLFCSPLVRAAEIDKRSPEKSNPGTQNSAETAAASALSQLYDAIARTELVPGLRDKA